MLYLGKQKWRLEKNGWDASQILRAVKRIEALKMNKYLHPGHFFLGSHRSTHDSGVKRVFMFFFQDVCQVASRVKAKLQITNVY
jgi:hypothetical protein